LGIAGRHVAASEFRYPVPHPMRAAWIPPDVDHELVMLGNVPGQFAFADGSRVQRILNT
jgi:hypothetical protein